MKVFWDTNLFIYFIERHPTYYPQVLALYQKCRARGDQLLTSALTLGEVLAQPLRSGHGNLMLEYKALLQDSGSFTLVSFTERCAGWYARIRADLGFRQPDALQVACALDAGARLFVTNDQKLWHSSVLGTLVIQAIDAVFPSE